MNCPKCGEHIGMLDLKVNCKKCGVNIFYYSQETELKRDAKITELDFASARYYVAKVKATFIGSKIAIARLVFLFVTVASLIVPFFDLNVNTPFFSGKLSMGSLGAYNLYNDGILLNLLSFLKVDLIKNTVLIYCVGLILFVIAVLLAVVNALAYILSFFEIKKSAKTMFVCSVICDVLFVCEAVIMLILRSNTKGFGVFDTKLGFGSFVAIAVFTVFAVLNYMIMKNGLELKVNDVDYQRIELRKKVKSGEVNIDDLPMPIFETEEEKQKRLDLMGEAGKKNDNSENKTEVSENG